MLKVYTILFCVFLCSCHANPGSGGVTPVPPVITDQTGCGAACKHLNDMNCDEGNPIDMHVSCNSNADCKPNQTCSSNNSCVVSCEQFCIDTENQGVWLAPECVMKITSCNQVNSCPLPN